METFPRPLMGFRTWSIENDGTCLTSYSSRMSWKVGTNYAYCHKRSHHAPDSDCECGLYAYYGINRAFSLSSHQFVGLIAARGKVELHNNGFRAEEAQIIALLPSPNLPYKDFVRLKKVAKHYKVPLLETEEEMINLAFETGEVLKDKKTHVPQQPPPPTGPPQTVEKSNFLTRPWEEHHLSLSGFFSIYLQAVLVISLFSLGAVLGGGGVWMVFAFSLMALTFFIVIAISISPRINKWIKPPLIGLLAGSLFLIGIFATPFAQRHDKEILQEQINQKTPELISLTEEYYKTTNTYPGEDEYEKFGLDLSDESWESDFEITPDQSDASIELSKHNIFDSLKVKFNFVDGALAQVECLDGFEPVCQDGELKIENEG